MSKGFQVDTEYQGYVFLGSAQGMFETREGQRVPYFNMFVFSPVSTYSSDDYQASGFKAEKKKCLNAEVWQGFNPGDKIKLFFDDKGRGQITAPGQLKRSYQKLECRETYRIYLDKFILTFN